MPALRKSRGGTDFQSSATVPHAGKPKLHIESGKEGERALPTG
jgi:hypothetical protein